MKLLRRGLVRVLVVFAAAPFAGVALLHCTKSTATTDAAASVDPASRGANSPPTQTPFEGAACVSLRHEVASFLDTHAACTKDGDCIEVKRGGQACGATVAGAFAAEFAAKAAAYEGAGCDVGAPMPSCAPHGPPKCVGGTCELPGPE